MTIGFAGAGGNGNCGAGSVAVGGGGISTRGWSAAGLKDDQASVAGRSAGLSTTAAAPPAAVISSKAASHFLPSLRLRRFGAGDGWGLPGIVSSGSASGGGGTLTTVPVRTAALTATKDGSVIVTDIDLWRRI